MKATLGVSYVQCIHSSNWQTMSKLKCDTDPNLSSEYRMTETDWLGALQLATEWSFWKVSH